MERNAQHLNFGKAQDNPIQSFSQIFTLPMLSGLIFLYFVSIDMFKLRFEQCPYGY